MRFTKITEADSNHDKLEQMSVEQLSIIINEEDQTVANAVKKYSLKSTLLLMQPYLKCSKGVG